MRISRFTFILVFLVTINEVNSGKGLRDFIDSLIQEVLRPFTSSEHQEGNEHRDDYHHYVKKLHHNLFYIKRPAMVGEDAVKEGVHDIATSTVIEEPSRLGVEGSESHFEQTPLPFPAVPHSASQERGSTASTSKATVVLTSTEAIAQLEPTAGITSEDLTTVIRPLIPESDGVKNFPQSQKHDSDAHLPMDPNVFHQKGNSQVATAQVEGNMEGVPESLEGHRNNSGGKIHSKETHLPPADSEGVDKKGSTPLPSPMVSSVGKTQLNLAADTAADDMQTTPQPMEVGGNDATSENDTVTDARLPSNLMSKTEASKSSIEDLDVRNKMESTRVNGDDNQKIIFRGNVEKTTEASIEDGYIIIDENE